MAYDFIHSSEVQEITLNGIRIEEDERWELIGEYVESTVHAPQPRCGYCDIPMHVVTQRAETQPGEEWIEEVIVAECPHCSLWHGMWYHDLGQGINGCPTAEWEARLGKLAEFENCLPEGCQPELARYLRAVPGGWNQLPPRRLETLVADIFKANYGSCEVLHVGQPNDGGVDVVFIDSGQHRWLVSVKRRIDHAKGEGVETLRNLLGAMLLDGSRYGIVVSSSDHFTYQARKAAHKAEEKGFTISLVDLGQLDRMVGQLLPVAEWQDLVLLRKPEWLTTLQDKMPNREQLTFGDYIRRIKARQTVYLA